MAKRFLCGVGEVKAFKGNNLVFSGKTLIDSGIEVSTSSTEIRGGMGNALQSIYYHTSAFNVTITDTQFSLPLIALNTGANVAVGSDVWYNETVTLSGYNGTISYTPTAVSETEPYVYCEYKDTYYSFPVTGTSFSVSGSSIPSGATICVAYLKSEVGASVIEIPANIIPDRLHVYITANLFGDISGQGAIGTATIEVPVLQLSGAQTISMTADGVANTPLSGMALSYNDTTGGCSEGAYYAKITEHLSSSNWYDGVTGLAIEGGDFTLSGVGTNATLRVYAIKNGSSFLANNSLLTFSSDTAGTATIGQHTGVVTTVGTGTTLLSVVITGATSIEASCTLTVE